jgi:hypothetical protein
MNTLLVNLYGAPCSGKSVKMMQLAVVGKMRRVFCELSAEVAKEYVVQHIPITRDIQLQLTAEQFRRTRCFVGHVEVLVTDAPPLIGAFYAGYREMPDLDALEQTFTQYDADLRAAAHKVIHVYMWRNHPYDEAGRLESECEDETISQRMWAFVREKHAGQTLLEARSTDSPDALWERIMAAADDEGGASIVI